jgi:hypothetical protein
MQLSDRKKVSYSIAMSKDTGAIVMVRTRGKVVEVMGAMTREQSMEFVKGIMEWSKEVIDEDRPRIMQLNG